MQILITTTLRIDSRSGNDEWLGASLIGRLFAVYDQGKIYCERRLLRYQDDMNPSHLDIPNLIMSWGWFDKILYSFYMAGKTSNTFSGISVGTVCGTLTAITISVSDCQCGGYAFKNISKNRYRALGIAGEIIVSGRAYLLKTHVSGCRSKK